MKFESLLALRFDGGSNYQYIINIIKSLMKLLLDNVLNDNGLLASLHLASLESTRSWVLSTVILLTVNPPFLIPSPGLSTSFVSLFLFL